MQVTTVKHEIMSIEEDGESCVSICGIWLRIDELGKTELIATKKEDVSCDVCTRKQEKLEMNWITDNVAVGNARDAMESHRLLQQGVTAVLNVANALEYSEYMHKDILYRHFGLNDGPGNPEIDFTDAVDALFKLVKNGHKVLVHCHAGMSRSPTVIAAWYAKENNIPLPEAMDFVQSKRQIAFPHPALRKLAWEYVHGKGYIHG